MDLRTLAPKPYIRYFPARYQQSSLKVRAYVEGQPPLEVDPVPKTALFAGQTSYEPTNPAALQSFGPTRRAPLRMLDPQLPGLYTFLTNVLSSTSQDPLSLPDLEIRVATQMSVFGFVVKMNGTGYGPSSLHRPLRRFWVMITDRNTGWSVLNSRTGMRYTLLPLEFYRKV
ncbi:unnamed protein product [Aspergillus oryzae]|uniref:Unnamed protein product n=1 Tax=Aspergillus oryzae TaxID=5062 RepID=A0AAN4YK31_ASPOZ|nr:unnamed protein product [Aspergillus oryzae]